MPPTAERPAGRRLALVVATGSYADATLAKLRAPGRDASELAAVLEDATLGGFEVELALDTPAEALRRRVAQFCARVAPGDLALMYLSCHGVLDDRGRLYYATTDTDRELLSATAVSSAWLNEQLEDCRGRRQILVLDCCHSGAFAKGAKGEGSLALRERFEGRGRVVLTGSRATEYSFEHGQVVGESVSSVFTGALVEGLRSGDADRDGDGVVTVSELYDYAYEAVRTREARQTPTLWTYGAEGDLLVAHSPRGAIVKPAPLPEDVVVLLESARSRVREGAVAELSDLLRGPDAGRALTARAQLERMAGEDLPSVAAAAQTALEAAPLAPATHAAQPGASPPSRAGVSHPPASPASSPAEPPTPPAPPRENGSRGAQGPPSPGRRRKLTVAAGVLAAAVVALVVVLLTAGGGGQSSGPTRIALGGSPRGIAVDEHVVWVAQHDFNQVSRIDASSRIESIPVGSRPGKVAAGEGSVWVSIEDGKRLVRIDERKHEVVKSSTIDLEADECGGCAASELAIAQGLLWVGSDERRAIVTFDVNTGEQRGESYHPGEGFHGVFAVDDQALWAVGNDNRSPVRSHVIEIGRTSYAVVNKPLRLGSYFSGVAYGLHTVWIADAEEGRNFVSAYDPLQQRIRANVRIDTGLTGDDITFAGGAIVVWEPVEGWLTRIDARTLKITRKRQIVEYAKDQEAKNDWSDFAVDGDFAWVTDPAGSAVFKERIDESA